VWHLSRPEHGFSKSRFVVRFLNPIRVRAELNHLGGRILIDRSAPNNAKKSSERLLGENKIISITAGAWEGRRVAATQFLKGTNGFHGSGSWRAKIRVIIDRPITVPSDPEVSARLALMTQEFCNRLEPHVLAHWKNLVLAKMPDSRIISMTVSSATTAIR
jgi:hypothetical protein